MNPEEPKKDVSSKQPFQWKKLFAKKWFFPAVYVAFAAFILGIAWWYQNNQAQEVSNTPIRGEMDTMLPDKPTQEEMIAPVPKNAQANVTMRFYDERSSTKQKEAALVQYANTFWPHMGIDYARKDGKSFPVITSQAGKVIRVEKSPMLGQVVEIQHDSGLVTVYQSLTDVKVKENQMVKKGQTIAQAGKNKFEKQAGVHLHFEVRKNKQGVNPEEYIQKES